MKLAVIPARAGSKRIPGKNIRDFRGKPMMAWSIDAALRSECFDRILVSTDDPAIAELATRFGAEAPFLRPPELADDHTPTVPVIAHAIEWQLRHGARPDLVCCLYATAPFVTAEDLRSSLAVMESEDVDYVFPVTRFPAPIQRALRLETAGRVSMWCPEHYLTRSQDLEPAYHDAGQYYWGRADAWLAGKSVFLSRTIAIELPAHRVQDIDSEDDWRRAELLFGQGPA